MVGVFQGIPLTRGKEMIHIIRSLVLEIFFIPPAAPLTKWIYGITSSSEHQQEFETRLGQLDPSANSSLAGLRPPA